jgi:hypothetical protein
MLKHVWSRIFALSLVSGLLAAYAAAQEHPAANLPIPRSSLTPEERARAVQLAVPQAPVISLFALQPNAARPPSAPNRVVISNVQAVGVGKTDKRLALVTMYQYEGNIAINRLVDLSTGVLVSEERVPNGSAPIAQVEIDYARSLVLADERVAALLSPFHDAATLEFILTTTADPNSPFYSKRVFGVLIKTPGGYLSVRQRIYADLTDGKVVIEE